MLRASILSSIAFMTECYFFLSQLDSTLFPLMLWSAYNRLVAKCCLSFKDLPELGLKLSCELLDDQY